MRRIELECFKSITGHRLDDSFVCQNLITVWRFCFSHRTPRDFQVAMAFRSRRESSTFASWVLSMMTPRYSAVVVLVIGVLFEENTWYFELNDICFVFLYVQVQAISSRNLTKTYARLRLTKRTDSQAKCTSRHATWTNSYKVRPKLGDPKRAHTTHFGWQ